MKNTQIILTAHSPVLLNMVQLDAVSIITNINCAAQITRIKDKKDLVKQLSGTFSSFGNIFFCDIAD